VRVLRSTLYFSMLCALLPRLLGIINKVESIHTRRTQHSLVFVTVLLLFMLAVHCFLLSLVARVLAIFILPNLSAVHLFQ
jgi:hypothetical protein